MSTGEKRTLQINAVLGKAVDLLILNFICLLCCVPVITIFDSLAALHAVTLKLLRNETDSVVKPFFRFFRENFVKSIPYTLIFLVTYAPGFAGVMTMAAGGMLWGLIVIPYTIILMILSGWVTVLFAQFDNSVGTTFGNALKIAVVNPKISLVLFAVNAYLPILFLVFPGVFGSVLYVWNLIGLAVQARIACVAALPVLNALMPEEVPVNEVIEVKEETENESGNEEL